MWATEWHGPDTGPETGHWKPVYFHDLRIVNALAWLASVSDIPVTYCRIRNVKTGEIILPKDLKAR